MITSIIADILSKLSPRGKALMQHNSRQRWIIFKSPMVHQEWSNRDSITLSNAEPSSWRLLPLKPLLHSIRLAGTITSRKTSWIYGRSWSEMMLNGSFKSRKTRKSRKKSTRLTIDPTWIGKWNMSKPNSNYPKSKPSMMPRLFKTKSRECKSLRHKNARLFKTRQRCSASRTTNWIYSTCFSKEKVSKKSSLRKERGWRRFIFKSKKNWWRWNLTKS